MEQQNETVQRGRTGERKLLEYGTVILTVACSYLVSRLFRLENNAAGMSCLRMVVLFLVTVGAVVVTRYLLTEKSLQREDNQIIVLIMVMGTAVRIIYMLYTACTTRSHDLWEISTDSYGHAAYILHIMQLKQLPQSNWIQFYQQPFFYFSGSVVSGIINGILGCNDPYYLVDATKVVSCIASCVSLMAGREIFEECHLTGKGLCRSMLLISFLPVTYLTGARVCPDALAGMFMVLAFLYTLRWLREQSWKNTIVLAFIYGFGVMTKISCAVMALFTGIIFIGCFWKAIRLKREKKDNQSWKSLMVRYLVFGCISLPLGLWYGIRNYVRFRQPLQYVVEIPKTNSIYTGDISLFRRILWIDWKNLLDSPYTAVREDYNLPVYAVKSSLFGEFQYEVPLWLPRTLLFFACLLTAFCVVAIVKYGMDLYKGQKKEQNCNLALLAAVIFYGSILSFYVRYPFGCSMDFRYMLFLPVPIAAILGKTQWKYPATGLYLDLCCIGFMAASCMMFC